MKQESLIDHVEDIFIKVIKTVIVAIVAYVVIFLVSYALITGEPPNLAKVKKSIATIRQVKQMSDAFIEKLQSMQAGQAQGQQMPIDLDKLQVLFGQSHKASPELEVLKLEVKKLRAELDDMKSRLRMVR